MNCLITGFPSQGMLSNGDYDWYRFGKKSFAVSRTAQAVAAANGVCASERNKIRKAISLFTGPGFPMVVTFGGSATYTVIPKQ